VPRDERPEAAIEKRSADGLDVGEVKAHAAGGFQRFGDLVVDLLRVGTRTHPTTMIAQLNDLHECATRWRFRSGVSRGPGGSLEEAKALRHDKANDEQRDQHPPSPSHACTSPPLPYMQRLNTAETSAVTPFPQLERARP